VKGINGTTLSALATGLLKNTTGSGVPSIAVAGTDYAAPNASTKVNGQTCALGGSCSITAVSEQTMSAYSPCSNLGSNPCGGWYFYPVAGSTVDRMDVSLGGTDPVGCTTSAVWSLYDATSAKIVMSVTFANGSYGPFSSTTQLNSFTAGDELELKATTLASGCSTLPQNPMTVVQWH
jgi:hypothetical protein